MKNHISQAEARRLRRQVKELQSTIEKITNAYCREFPGTHIGSITVQDVTAARLDVARKLGHVVVVPELIAQWRKYADLRALDGGPPSQGMRVGIRRCADELEAALARQEPVGHLHSNGEFCAERLPSTSEWPISLYAAPVAERPAVDLEQLTRWAELCEKGHGSDVVAGEIRLVIDSHKENSNG